MLNRHVEKRHVTIIAATRSRQFYRTDRATGAVVTTSLRRIVREREPRGRWGPRSGWTAPKNNESIFARCPQISRRTRWTAEPGHPREEADGERQECAKNQFIYHTGHVSSGWHASLVQRLALNSCVLVRAQRGASLRQSRKLYIHM